MPRPLSVRIRLGRSMQGNPPAPVVMGLGGQEVGDVDSTTIEVTFTKDVFSPGSDYAVGVTIKVNAVSQTINSSARQDPTNNLVHYVIASVVDINDAVTWEYDGDVGDLEDADTGDPVADIGSVSVTNFVGSHFYFDELWDSAHAGATA